MKFARSIICSSLMTLALETSAQIPGERLELGIENSITTNQGVLIPSQLFELTIGRLVKIYRPDGFCYQGKVTRIEKASEYYKVLGVINNVDDSGFGFVLTKDGKFAGAVLERGKKKLYTLVYSEEINGFILVLSVLPDEA